MSIHTHNTWEKVSPYSEILKNYSLTTLKYKVLCIFVKTVWVLSRFSHVWLFSTLSTVACQASLSMGFSRQEYSHSLLQGVFPTQGSNPGLLHYRQILYHWAISFAYFWALHFVPVQPVKLYLTLCDPRIAAHQASLSFTVSQSLLKFISIESVMRSNHLNLCCLILYLVYAWYHNVIQFSSVAQLFWLFATPWTAALQASLSITNSRSLLKIMFIESVMPSSHLILCRPLLLPPSIFPSIRIFSNKSAHCIRWPKYLEFQLQHQSFQ